MTKFKFDMSGNDLRHEHTFITPLLIKSVSRKFISKSHKKVVQ